MKRTFAAVILLAALGAFVKLALKPAAATRPDRTSAVAKSHPELGRPRSRPGRPLPRRGRPRPAGLSFVPPECPGDRAVRRHPGLDLARRPRGRSGLPLREASRRLRPAPRHPRRRLGGRDPPPLARLFRLQAGRRHRPEADHRRDRPPRPVRAQGRRQVPQRPPADPDRPGRRDRTGRPLVGRPRRPRTTPSPCSPSSTWNRARPTSAPPSGPWTSTARSPSTPSARRASTGSPWSSCMARF